MIERITKSGRITPMEEIPRTPAMTTGMIERITKSGRITPMEEIPTPDLAVPYAAPRFAKTIAEVTPMKPKKDEDGSHAARMLDAAKSGIAQLGTNEFPYDDLMPQNGLSLK